MMRETKNQFCLTRAAAMNPRGARSKYPSVAFILATLLSASISARAEEMIPKKSVTDLAVLSNLALVSAGNTARLQRALAKARRGGTVTIGTIGGSITAGASASQPSKNYPNLVAKWWRDHFPSATIKLVNAGIGATCSDFGAHRVKRDLLAQQPDFVIVEYSVNDYTFPLNKETMEGLARQILNAPGQPGLMMLFMMNSDGSNRQAEHSLIGVHYNLPMISYHDALWPEIQAGRLAWSDISPDPVHPNDRGHQYCADFIGAFLNQVLASLPADSALPAIPAVPAPLVSDVFEHTALWYAADIPPAETNGWSIGPEMAAYGKCRQASTAGSVIAFDFEGTTVGILYYKVKGAMGKARAQVDTETPVEMDAYFDQTWGGWNPYQLVASHLKPGRHRLRIEVLNDKNPASTGHLFQINAIMAAGTGR